MKTESACGVLVAIFACVALAAAPVLAQPPSILMISVDTVRADHLSCYGHSHRTSPNIDALAESGVRFEDTTAAAPWTVPSHMSMFTGLYPDFHGCVSVESRLYDGIPTLAGTLRENGYATAAFVTGPMLNRRMGFSKGFDLYDDYSALMLLETDILGEREPGAKGLNGVETCSTVTRLAQAWLERNTSRPFFLFVHYWDAHADYIPPPPHDRAFFSEYAGRENGRDVVARMGEILAPGFPPDDLERLVALYDGEIRHVDAHVGKLLGTLDALGLERDCVVLLTADHGEQFKEHGELTHGRSVFQEEVHVPLILRWPGRIPAGTSAPGLSSHVDISPTLLGLLGLDSPDPCQGLDLSSVCRGEEDRVPDRVVLCQQSGARRLRMARRGDLKLMETGIPAERRFYDLGADPAEQKDLQGAALAGLGAQRDDLAQVLGLADAQAEAWRKNRATGESHPDERTLDLLKQLGYM